FPRCRFPVGCTPEKTFSTNFAILEELLAIKKALPRETNFWRSKKCGKRADANDSCELQRTNRLKSKFLARSPMFFSTNAASPSVRISASYCLMRHASVSVRMRRKSSSFKGDSSTLIGNLPCNSGKRSEGFDAWKAPEAMNRM